MTTEELDRLAASLQDAVKHEVDRAMGELKAFVTYEVRRTIQSELRGEIATAVREAVARGLGVQLTLKGP